MVKRTLYFGSPAYLSLSNSQMVIDVPETKDSAPVHKTAPIEDIGVLVLDNSRITITHALLECLLENNVAVITCNSSHMPVGLMLPLEGNTLQSERYRYQTDASLPLKKQLWQQTVQCKILNQAAVLKRYRNLPSANMEAWAADVRSGDVENMESRAAVYYWSHLFPYEKGFIRDRNGTPPNHLLNYGYAILRAMVARSLVGSGLLPTLGIHHRNKYNAYCLADDIMEPYRPYVDTAVCDIVDSGIDTEELTKDIKSRLLSIPVMEVRINENRSPMMVAIAQTTASLYKCYKGESRRILYPRMD